MTISGLIVGESVRCNHEAYQGSCAHCNAPLIGGRAVVFSGEMFIEHAAKALATSKGKAWGNLSRVDRDILTEDALTVARAWGLV